MRLFRDKDGRDTVTYILADRKMQLEPVEVVRSCICQLQGKRLCGVCVVKRRWNDGPLFPDITYREALAFLKLSATHLGLEHGASWGTHAFRRGWANEALQEGGPKALYYSGGWKGVAALGYADDQSRGALAAAEWVIDFSDSSDSE